MIEKVFQEEKKQVQTINYIFCSDAYLLSMNQTYLKHDTLTDIITFQLNEPHEPVISDIFVSVERVKENASGLEVTQTEELLRVIFHGALHLCGYKDKSKKAQAIMRSKEDYYLTLFKRFT